MKHAYQVARLLAGAALLAVPTLLHAQSVGIGTATPDPSAALDVSSTTQGLLPPRLRQSERDLIATPTTGLVVYQTDNVPGLYSFDGTAWHLLAADNLGNHQATQNLGLNDYDLRLRTAGDTNHGLGWYGISTSAKNWLGLDIDGPVLYGNSGGVLGTNSGSVRTAALYWNSAGRVGIGTLTPFSQLANTNDNIIGSDGNGGNPGSLAWSANQAGYAGQFFNAGAANNANGLAVKIASPTAAAFDVSQEAGVGTIGKSLLRVLGNGNVGIGTNTPSQALEVAGQVKITGGSPGAGKVLTSDAAGLATWQPASTGLLTIDTEVAPTAALTLDLPAAVVALTDNAAANGTITLGTGADGQQLLLTNLDVGPLSVTSASGTGNVLPGQVAQFLHVGGSWRRVN